MLTGDPFRVAVGVIWGPHERSEPGPAAPHVAAAGAAGQIIGCLTEHEIDLGREGPGLERQIGPRRVGGAEDHLAEPRNCKQHPPITGPGNDQCSLRWEELPIHHQMDPLARRHHRSRRWIVEPPHGIHPNPGRVDHASGGHLKMSAGLSVENFNDLELL